MLEESAIAMEKKSSNRQSSVPPKQNGSESKKSDNGNQKQVSSKYARRRENNGSKSYYQDSSPRRTTPQKQRYNVDKRPRPRGGGYSREEVTEEYPIDYGSPLLKGKKVNLNHLLNFSYARAETYDDPPHWRGAGARGSGRRRQSGKVSYNKEQFLQANCQFIVKEKGDYAIHNIDPDKLVDWEAVELIRMNGHEVSSCPICLDKPLAAKMTRCGHIYCWPCILHYLALGEKSWRKCPICYESVHESDLKSVMMQEVHKFKSGETITMTLMRREKGMTYALPKYLWEKKEGSIHSYNDETKKTNFLKLLSISEEDILTYVLQPERQALQKKLEEAETSEVAFIDSALHLLKSRESFVAKSSGTSTRSSSSSESTEEVEIPVVTSKILPSTQTKTYSSAFSDEEEEVKVLPQTEEEDPVLESIAIQQMSKCRTTGDDTTMEPEREVGAICGSPQDPRQSPPVDLVPDSLPVEEAAEHLEMPLIVDDQQNKKRPINDNAFYFYQASDGQHIYLHALNARCLVKEYGSLSECPQTITANIVQMENIFMTEELRKRLRYLGHLPLTCEFEVAELALKPPVISKDTIRFFSEEIDKRRRLRQKKNREERRWNRKAQDEENKKMAKYNIYGTDSKIVQSQFVPGVLSVNRPSSPAAKSDDSSQSMSSLNTPVGSPLVDTEISENADGQQSSGFSFAQMLKAGQAKTPSWPKVKPKAEATSPPETSRSKDSDGSDNEDKVPVPMFRESFGDAIQLALDSHMALAQGDSIEVQSTEKNKGKKKKKQQTLLFATSMARGGK